ncbi:MAG: hypothetical protein ACR2HV_00735 [Acidimicrobiales bacterium]
MKSGRRNPKSARRSGGSPDAGPSPVDFWRTVPDAGVPEPITPAADPTALLRSLGRPPLPGQASADRYVATVIERAAATATAVAASADLLATEEE